MAADTESDRSSAENQRLAEVVGYALEVTSRRTGSGLGAVKHLAEALGTSTTMVHRYRSGRTCFGNLKAATVEALARAAGMEIGAVHAWIHGGREAAFSYERRLSGQSAGLDVESLWRQLGEALRSEGRFDGGGAAGLKLVDLRLDLDAQRQRAPELFDTLVRALSAESLLQAVYDEEEPLSELDERQRSCLAQLLGTTEPGVDRLYGKGA